MMSFGIVIEVKDEHSLKANSPISRTVSGIVIDRREVQDWNALFPIFVTV